jgi:hypothetical protein
MHFKNLMNNLDENPDLIELSKRNNKTFHYEHSSYSFFNLIGFLFINFKTNQFIQKEFSQNKKLVDQDLYNKIFLIYNSETLFPKFEKDIIPKISGFKSYTVLDQGITSFINISNNWNLNYFKTEFYKNNLDFYSPKKNILILKLENFETCVNFCPPSWCIKKDKRLLDNRILSKKNIYLVLNFNYTSIESLSMVGITLDRNLHIVERYDKFNKSFIRDPYSIKVNHYISKLISRKKLYKKIKPLTSFFKKIFLLN